MNAGLANFRWGCGVEVRGTCAWCGSLGGGWVIELGDAVYGQVNEDIMKYCVCVVFTLILDFVGELLSSTVDVAW